MTPTYNIKAWIFKVILKIPNTTTILNLKHKKVLDKQGHF